MKPWTFPPNIPATPTLKHNVNPVERLTCGLSRVFARIRSARAQPHFSLFRGSSDPTFEAGACLFDRYTIEKDAFGVGRFSRVVFCKDSFNRDLQVAVKVFHPEFAIVGHAEIFTLRSLQSKIGNLDSARIIEPKTAFEAAGKVCVVYDRLCETLESRSDRFRHLPDPFPTFQKIAFQLLLALASLHGAGLAHCDLKPANVMFVADSGWKLKLIDFGNAEGGTNTPSPSSLPHSAAYRPPDCLEGTLAQSDCWALGCLLLELLLGTHPFLDRENVGKLCSSGSFRDKARCATSLLRASLPPSALLGPAAAFLLPLLEAAPRRSTAIEAMHHPFLTRLVPLRSVHLLLLQGRLAGKERGGQPAKKRRRLGGLHKAK